MADIREEYLGKFFEEVSPKEFYRDIFPEGELQEKGVTGDMRYNAIAIEVLPADDKKNTRRYTITDDLDMVDELITHKNFILLSPISYVGKSRDAANARFIYALAIDLDGVNKETNMVDLFHQIEYAEFLPRPTYIVSSGNGLHIYYVFKEPIPCFKNITDQLSKLKHNLTKKLWNGYITSMSENVQYQSLFQGFRLVGGVTKSGGRTKAYKIGDRVSIEYLNDFVEPENQLTQFSYKSELTLEQAKKKYPEWYEKRIVKQVPKGSWVCKRDLYEWWKQKIYSEIVEGHRYYGVMCLSIYAKKCGISREELEKDAFGMIERLDKMTKEDDNHFTEGDVLSALELYNDNYITFPIDTISSLTNVRIDRNKRNGRKQEQHLKLARGIRALKGQMGESVAGGGRPSKKEVVEAYLKQHPTATKAEVIRETGLSKPTVYKYYENVIKST